MAKVISKTGRRVQRPLTAARKRAFLDELRRHGIAAESARVASPHSRARHGAASTFRQDLYNFAGVILIFDESDGIVFIYNY